MAREKSTPAQQPANRAGQRHIAEFAGWCVPYSPKPLPVRITASVCRLGAV